MSTTHDHGQRVRPRRLAVLALTVVTGLATGLGGAMVTETGAVAATSYGSFAAPSGTLPAANTCGTYTYRYTVSPPGDNWLLNTTVIDPRGNPVSSYSALGNGYSAGGTDATTSFTLCRNSTIPGVFTIVGDLSTESQNARGESVTTTYQTTPGTFTLTDGPVATTTQKAKKSKKAKKRAKAKRKAELRKKKRLKNRR